MSKLKYALYHFAKFGFEFKRNKNKDEHVKTVKTSNVTIINKKTGFQIYVLTPHKLIEI